jgi:hypothetical protein
MIPVAIPSPLWTLTSLMPAADTRFLKSSSLRSLEPTFIIQISIIVAYGSGGVNVMSSQMRTLARGSAGRADARCLSKLTETSSVNPWRQRRTWYIKAPIPRVSQLPVAPRSSGGEKERLHMIRLTFERLPPMEIQGHFSYLLQNRII